MTEHLAPFQIVTEESINGLSTEIITAALHESQINYSLEAHPWSHSYNRALHVANTCIYSLAYIPERKEKFQWVGHITTSSISLYALSKNAIAIKNIEQAKNYRIAVIKDDVTHHFLMSKGFVENKNLYVMNNYDSLLKLLEIPNRQIDLIVLNDDLLKNRVQNSAETQKYKAVFMLEELTLDFRFACSLNTDKTIVNSLKKAMDKMERQGVNSAIRKKWQRQMVSLIELN
ncbi:substrate-binding periplasmic protein [Cognaticolwellia mytili]|uniref:substrate-binding periplasmic protein n=1 Tax=Cognaticolwellia mytili TaxID=1888913 RepID=UPI001301AC4F|nr:ABC transporter substrate-binding protein [Cognaticolwellia mytili]